MKLTSSLCMAVAVALIGQAVIGCSDRRETTRRTGPDDGRSWETVVSTAQTADSAKLAEVIQEHAGKCVFVDFWATWCPPCVEQFPHTVEMSNKYRDKGLVVVSISMDGLTDKPIVDAFLIKHKAEFMNLIQGTTMAEAFADFQLSEVPTYRLYGPDGTLLQEFNGESSSEEIEAYVAGHLPAPTK